MSLPPIPTNPHPFAHTYFPPIPPFRPKIGLVKPRLSEILLPHRPLLTSTSLPLLRSPPATALTGNGDGFGKANGKLNKLKRMGSEMLVKVGVKKDETWGMVGEAQHIPGPRPKIVLDQHTEQDGGIPQRPLSTSFQPEMNGLGSQLTFGSPHPTSSHGNLGSDTETGGSDSSSGSKLQVHVLERLKENTNESAFTSAFSAGLAAPQVLYARPLPDDHPFKGGWPPSQDARSPGAIGVWDQEEVPLSSPREVLTPSSPRSPVTPKTPGTRDSSQLLPWTSKSDSVQYLDRPADYSIDDVPHLRSMLSSLLHLRTLLYAHAISCHKLLEGYEELLPGFVYRDYGRQMDHWWHRWRKVLNTLGIACATALLSFPSPPPPPESLSPSSPIMMFPPSEPLPPPFTQDSLEEHVWVLEESGVVPSFTFQRMFGRDVRVRKLENEEVWEASRNGWREWQNDEWGNLQREHWRLHHNVEGFGHGGRKAKKCVA
ncbi:hypothetical protein L204_105469 [Cryptococcus depauperatus]|nr:hypothetical protein L204_02763 [Cryptococcus depauperatus CBS 7855]